jgi:hypothetical protein
LVFIRFGCGRRQATGFVLAIVNTIFVDKAPSIGRHETWREAGITERFLIRSNKRRLVLSISVTIDPVMTLFGQLWLIANG